VPPLRDGNRLAGKEFDRRYAATPDGTKAELIEGIVYMPPPCFEEDHGAPHSDLVAWLGHYRAGTPGVIVSDNTSLRLDPRNRPQPDAYLRVLHTHGGRTRVARDGYVEGAPELVVEIAASSIDRDLGEKFATYRRNGVREYLVWRTPDREFDWLLLGPRRHTRLRASREGVYKSRVFPGLWLDAPAMLRGDLATVLKVLQQGIASPEHAAFVAKLAKAAARRK
jgi:Uma2 family endonuclease